MFMWFSRLAYTTAAGLGVPTAPPQDSAGRILGKRSGEGDRGVMRFGAEGGPGQAALRLLGGFKTSIVTES